MARSSAAPASFLPDFCGTRTVFVIVLLAELLAVTLTLAQPLLNQARLVDLALYSLFIQWAALSCIAILCIFRQHLNTLPDLQVGVISYLITLLTTLLVAELAWWTQYHLAAWDNTAREHGSYLLRIMGISAIVWALALRYFYVQYQLRRQVEAEAESRFQALQSRIRPHFLFNCMNTIASLVRRDPQAAEQVVEDLAELFRQTLRDRQQVTSLEQELDLCRRYLRIEQLRLGERLQVAWQIESVPRGISLPALTLQPLLENAIYHGIERLPEGGRIEVRSERQPGRLLIHIDNPVGEGGAAQAGNRLAQDNVRQRLGAFFMITDPLQIRHDGGHYRVTLTIPYDYETPDR
jgi:two-component system sensor histidine kinase AlgZ